jgi:hypothetical protein
VTVGSSNYKFFSSMQIMTGAIFFVLGCSPFVANKVDMRQEVSTLSPHLTKLITNFKATVKSEIYREILLATQKFVNNNSIHGVSPPYCDLWKEECKDQMAEAFNDAVEGGKKPDVFCSHRAFVMRLILSYGYGLKTRRVNLVNRTMSGHVMVEVYNPDTQRWELYDPDYYIYYQTGGKVLSLEDVIRLDPENDYVPCSSKGCGWEIIHSREGLNPHVLKGNFFYGVGFSEGEIAFVNSRNFTKPVDLNWVKAHTKTSNVLVFK